MKRWKWINPISHFVIENKLITFIVTRMLQNIAYITEMHKRILNWKNSIFKYNFNKTEVAKIIISKKYSNNK